MGFGTGIFLLTVGGILAFAIRTDVGWLDINAAGYVLMVSGVAVLLVTWWFWRDRRRRMTRSTVEYQRTARGIGASPPPPAPPSAPPTAPPPPHPQ
jgi:membrane protein implicated in regulation of membrane protease activity